MSAMRRGTLLSSLTLPAHRVCWVWGKICNQLRKKSKQSNKERSTNKPSWLSPDDVDLAKSAQENARRLLNNKYGSGNWRPGPDSEFNKIVKWINRSLKTIFGFTKLFGLEDEE